MRVEIEVNEIMVNKIIGVWELISFYQYSENKTKTYPFGENAKGYLIYTNNSYMSVNIMRQHRANYNTSGDIMNGTIKEKVIAVEGCTSYAGRYKIIKDKIIHQIDISLVPNLIGSKLERKFTIVGNQLKLTTPEFFVNRALQQAELIWKRT